MPARKQFKTSLKVGEKLERLLANAKSREVSEEELHEQRVSFAYGNAPDSELITKDTVRHASEHIKLKA